MRLKQQQLSGVPVFLLVQMLLKKKISLLRLNYSSSRCKNPLRRLEEAAAEVHSLSRDAQGEFLLHKCCQDASALILLEDLRWRSCSCSIQESTTKMDVSTILVAILVLLLGKVAIDWWKMYRQTFDGMPSACGGEKKNHKILFFSLTFTRPLPFPHFWRKYL